MRDSEPPVVPTTTYTVRTQDLLKQADIVARNAKVRVPDTILQVVDRAIQARKHCTAWFESTGIVNGHSTEGHVHFISILEEAVTILKSSSGTAKSSETTQDSNLATKSTEKAKPKPKWEEHDLSGLSNRFSNLEVQELEEIVHTATTMQILSASSKPARGFPSGTQGKGMDVYELESDNSFDTAFDIFCFFEDLHRIQDFLGETWKSYKT